MAVGQGVAFEVGRLVADPDWTSYRIGYTPFYAAPVELQLLGVGMSDAGSLERRVYALGGDLALFRGGRPGAYMVGGLAGGLLDRPSNVPDAGETSTWWSWSVGAGYELFPLSFLVLGAETRWREQPTIDERGLEFALRLGLRWGGSRAARPSPPSAGPVRVATAADARPRSGETMEWWTTGTADSVGREDGSSSGGAGDESGGTVTRSEAGTLREGVIATAREVLGRRYRLGGRGEDGGGFDCSGLIQYAYASYGIELPRRSVEQAKEGRAIARELDKLLPGDLLTFANRGRRVSHVGMYVGDGQFIHSASKGVQISRLSEDDPYGRWWWKRWVGVRRIVE